MSTNTRFVSICWTRLPTLDGGTLSSPCAIARRIDTGCIRLTGICFRLPGLERVDVVVTDATLAGPFHERIHHWLPGIEEVRAPSSPSPSPFPLPPSPFIVTRDREEEIIEFARRVRDEAASDGGILDRSALVVRQRLPYVYLAREVLRSTGVPFQMFDALPLAAEPYAAVVDVLFSCVSANFARVPVIALLRSPHLQFASSDGRVLGLTEVAALAVR